MLAATGTKHDQDQNKDSIANIEATGVFSNLPHFHAKLGQF